MGEPERTCSTSDPPGLSGPGYDVLTDTRPLTAVPVPAPGDPQWYAEVLSAGDWFAGVVDVGAQVPSSHISARHAGRASVLDLWWRRPDAMPVVLAASNGDGAAALQRLLGLLEADGLAPARAVVGLVDVAGSAPSRRVRRQLDALSGQVRAAVSIPFDPAIRAYGLRRLDAVSDAVLGAVRIIAQEAAGSVHPHRPDEEAPSGRWVPVRHRVAATPYVPPDEFDEDQSDEDRPERDQADQHQADRHQADQHQSDPDQADRHEARRGVVSGQGPATPTP